MTVALMIIALLVGLAIGFYLGLEAPRTKQPQINFADDEMTERLKKEYRNFLSYDGTEQED